MAFEEKDYLQLSGLQHFSFCRRQWALIHVEKQWEENIRTVEGKHFHKRAHDARFRERRGDVLIVRGISCSSKELGVSGQCDVLEMHKTCDTENGIEIRGCEGLWVPYPVEYKKGASKQFDADRLVVLSGDVPGGNVVCGDPGRCSFLWRDQAKGGGIIFRVAAESGSKLSDGNAWIFFQRIYTQSEAF